MEKALIYARCKILAFLPWPLFISISKGTLWEIILNGRWFYTLHRERRKQFPNSPQPSILLKNKLDHKLEAPQAWAGKSPKGIPSYAGATNISYEKCDF